MLVKTVKGEKFDHFSPNCSMTRRWMLNPSLVQKYTSAFTAINPQVTQGKLSGGFLLRMGRNMETDYGGSDDRLV